MKELLEAVQREVLAEYDRAAETHGPANNSPHESHSIIMEERDEVVDEVNHFEHIFNAYWRAVKLNSSDKMMNHLSSMQAIATRAAAEWIQVAAMCYKARKEKP